jgi:hypothetical protein
MLRIRRREMDALAEAEKRSFVDHVVSILRKHYKKAFEEQGEEAAKSFVHAWLPEARAHGIVTEKDTAQLLNILFAVVTDLGLDPRKTPWVKDVLADPSLTPTGKIYRLYVSLYEAYDRAAGATVRA